MNRIPIFAVLFALAAFGLYYFGMGERNHADPIGPGAKTAEESRPEAGDLPDVTGAASSAAQTGESGRTGASPGAKLVGDQVDPSVGKTLPDIDPRVAGWIGQYGALDVDGLKAELATLEERFTTERDTALEDRFTLGQYDTISPGELPTLSRHSMTGMTLLSKTRSGTDPDTMQIQAQIAVLSEEEYGAIYGLMNEIAWLKAKIGN